MVFKKGRLIFSKRGVSPLIATVLLIAFAVALGAMVMNLGSLYADAGDGEGIQQPNADCSGVAINIYRIEGREQVFYESSGKDIRITFMIENSGLKQIRGVKAIVVGDSRNVLTKDFSQVVDAASVLREALEYDADAYGEIVDIKFIPLIEVAGTPFPCQKMAINAERLPQAN
ncbi:hypothetical protein COT48_02690 [Candidatus Woesearchaeota archaeon CG08_land_8_20_14_0_20_47_9]|nr:MAG: hypothetical protein AUJ69_00245 [Candidatus Woesearchaeota archaeon CG1_02_47_18]PIO03995.1 MAG: hypothetical protein COT48_02690 [Candidatus Woesearchaeota archaeon CG08_land_8_20_14_0_20_47_9]HII29747.1 hypothetical protein [Candidatus Woesearchaeota archaeon]